ncbi:ThuA domain-containing protein [Asticcacaulis sp.]|uniref:ThuA domain-containing protein n=1 Tax=Asticcacaulis sp. TaxID=1872648 RepID=UPI002CA58A52|nr:ThuA domain-containing protein [Asticcacaulis sp.]HTM82275.1 ThuA domain-containing protein [Asticcacaulis sp.]
MQMINWYSHALVTCSKKVVSSLVALCAASVLSGFAAQDQSGLEGAHVLVFSKTAGFRHDSIAKGQATLEALGKANGFEVTTTEDAHAFTAESLMAYDAVVFFNTTGDVLDEPQQQALEGFVRAGHGVLGMHSATDTESDGKWPWYTALMGAHFKAHPEIQEARLVVASPEDPAIINNPAFAGKVEIRVKDEWYDFRNESPNVHPILLVDRQSYTGSTATGLSPIVWSNRYDGGRAFYIGLGHRIELYDTPMLQELMLDGLKFVLVPR